jgi:hypothetical protein
MWKSLSLNIVISFLNTNFSSFPWKDTALCISIMLDVLGRASICIMLYVLGVGVFAMRPPILRYSTLAGMYVHVFMLFGWNGGGNFVRRPVTIQTVVTPGVPAVVIVTDHTILCWPESVELPPFLIVTTVPPILTGGHTSWISTNVNFMSI